jgi:hypothetical protein
MAPLAFYQLADWLIANRQIPDGDLLCLRLAIAGSCERETQAANRKTP